MKQPDLLEDRVQDLFMRYLIPSVSATLVTSIYIFADAVMIGRGVGALGMAALNILLPLFSLFFGTGMLFGVGGSVLFSISKGRSDEKQAKEFFTVACLMGFITGIFYVLFFLLFFDHVTGFLGRNDTMDQFVREYGIVLVAGAPVFLFSSLLQVFVRNDRAPKTAMIAVIAGGVSNVILDYLFIFPLGMGMRGGAIATVLGSVITLMILSTHFFSKMNTLTLSKNLSWVKAKDVVVNGFASFLLDMSTGVVMFLFNRQTLFYMGDLGVVVYGIISNSALIVMSVSNGIAQAAQPIFAVNFGAGRMERVSLTRRIGEKVMVLSGVVFLAIGLFFPEVVTRAFIEATPEIMELSVPAVRIYFVSFVAMGINILLSTYFQSIMKPKYSLIICLLRGFVLNGVLVFLLPLLIGVRGIWLTIVFTEFITALVSLYLLKKKR